LLWSAVQAALLGGLVRREMLDGSEARVTQLHSGSPPSAAVESETQVSYSETVAVQVLGIWLHMLVTPPATQAE
jgi:hypothetical protein